MESGGRIALQLKKIEDTIFLRRKLYAGSLNNDILSQ